MSTNSSSSSSSPTATTTYFDFPLLRSSYDDNNSASKSNNNLIIQTPSDLQTVPMILPVMVLFFFLVGFFTVYLFHDILHYISSVWLLRGFEEQTTTAAAAATRQYHQEPEPSHGLHPTILATFPVFPYSSVHKLRKKNRRKCGLVCAICLSEFGDDDDVRLLTICNHVFHPHCIDTWLQSHVTCPVCRCNLEDNKPEDSVTIAVMQMEGQKDDFDDDDDGVVVVCVVEEGTSGGVRNNSTIHSRGNSSSVRVDDDISVEESPVEEQDEDEEEEGGEGGEEGEDKYTLRLPEHSEGRIVYLRSVSVSSTATT